MSLEGSGVSLWLVGLCSLQMVQVQSVETAYARDGFQLSSWGIGLTVGQMCEHVVRTWLYDAANLMAVTCIVQLVWFFCYCGDGMAVGFGIVIGPASSLVAARACKW